MVEIPRALKLEVLEEAHQIVHKTLQSENQAAKVCPSYTLCLLEFHKYLSSKFNVYKDFVVLSNRVQVRAWTAPQADTASGAAL